MELHHPDHPYAQWTTPRVNPTSTSPGSQITVSGWGFWPGEQVHATLHSTPVDLGTVTAGGHGTLTLTTIVPTSLPAGSHAITLTGATSGRTASADLTITPGVTAAAASTTDLADTGNPTLPLTGLALGLLLTGAGVLQLARRRPVVVRRRTTTTFGH